MATLTVVAVNDTYLSADYLYFFVAALNQQDRTDFNVIWINQMKDPQPLQSALNAAQFPYVIFQVAYPYVGDVCCWEIPQTLQAVLQHPLMGTYLAFLHKECVPAPDFVASILRGIADAESVHGSDNVYILNQLRSPLTLADLSRSDWYGYLQQTPAQSWSQRNIFQRQPFLWREERWLEDTFCIPVHVAKQLNCFGCVEVPLFFQDVFDLFLQLSERSYCHHLRWLRLGGGVIYHLSHPRVFYELSQAFLVQVRQHPQLFGHLALYEFADSDFDYQEPFVKGERLIDFKINRAIHYLQYSQKGTMTLWMQALDRYQGFNAGR